MMTFGLAKKKIDLALVVEAATASPAGRAWADAASFGQNAITGFPAIDDNGTSSLLESDLHRSAAEWFNPELMVVVPEAGLFAGLLKRCDFFDETLVTESVSA